MNNLSSSSILQDSIFRFHVRVNEKRTTISIDPSLFQALTYKTGSSTQAKEWIHKELLGLTKSGSVSRTIQGRIALYLSGINQEHQNSLTVRSATEDSNPL